MNNNPSQKVWSFSLIGLLAALSVVHSQAATFSWPMFHGTASHTGYASVQGPAKAHVKWKYQATAGGKGAPPNSLAIDAKGTVYLGTPTALIAFKSTGAKIWTYSGTSIQGPGLSPDGKTIYASSDKSIIAVNAADGSLKWSYLTGGEVHFGPTIGPDGTVYEGSWDKYFYALKSDGTVKWSYLTDGAISYPPSIDSKGRIYLGGGDAHAGPDGNVYAFDAAGNLLWKYDTKQTRVGSPAVGADGKLYVPAAPKLFVLTRDGKVSWSKGPNVSSSSACGQPPLPPCQGPTSNTNSGVGTSTDKGDMSGIITPAIMPDGSLFVGTSEGKIIALNTKTKTVLWKYSTKADPDKTSNYGTPSFPVVDKNGTVYIGSVDHAMYAVNKKGKLVWKYKTGGGISEAAPALGSDGTLYFTSDDGYLYAVGK